MCDCLEVLLANGYLTTATFIDNKTGNTTPRIVLAQLKEGKDGRLSVKPHWLIVNNCPNCGAKIEKDYFQTADSNAS